MISASRVSCFDAWPVCAETSRIAASLEKLVASTADLYQATLDLCWLLLGCGCGDIHGSAGLRITVRSINERPTVTKKNHDALSEPSAEDRSIHRARRAIKLLRPGPVHAFRKDFVTLPDDPRERAEKLLSRGERLDGALRVRDAHKLMNVELVVQSSADCTPNMRHHAISSTATAMTRPAAQSTGAVQPKLAPERRRMSVAAGLRMQLQSKSKALRTALRNHESPYKTPDLVRGDRLYFTGTPRQTTSSTAWLKRAGIWLIRIGQ